MSSLKEKNEECETFLSSLGINTHVKLFMLSSFFLAFLMQAKFSCRMRYALMLVKWKPPLWTFFFEILRKGLTLHVQRKVCLAVYAIPSCTYRVSFKKIHKDDTWNDFSIFFLTLNAFAPTPHLCHLFCNMSIPERIKCLSEVNDDYWFAYLFSHEMVWWLIRQYQ